jgi:hypothetical protein
MSFSAYAHRPFHYDKTRPALRPSSQQDSYETSMKEPRDRQKAMRKKRKLIESVAVTEIASSYETGVEFVGSQFDNISSLDINSSDILNNLTEPSDLSKIGLFPEQENEEFVIFGRDSPVFHRSTGSYRIVPLHFLRENAEYYRLAIRSTSYTHLTVRKINSL